MILIMENKLEDRLEIAIHITGLVASIAGLAYVYVKHRYTKKE